MEPLAELELLALDDDALEPDVLDDPEDEEDDEVMAAWIKELTAWAAAFSTVADEVFFAAAADAKAWLINVSACSS